jgi:PAS domain S-box-containing protein
MAGTPRGTFLRTRAWQLYLAAGGMAAVLYLTVPTLNEKGPFFNLIGISSVVAIAAGIRLHRPTRPLPWYLFAGGMFVFLVGDVFYYTIPKFTHQTVPFPSTGDVFYLSVYPLLIAGVVLLIHYRNHAPDRGGLLDALIISTGVALVAWVFLILPYASDPTLTLVRKLVSVAYPVMDVLLLAVAARLAMDSGLRRPAFHLLFLSMLCLLGADTAYGLIVLHGTYTTGSALDAGWIAFYVLWGAAALHPSMRTLAIPATEQRTKLTAWRLGLLAAATLMAPAMQLFQGVVGYAPVVVVAGSVALFLLVVARMADVIDRSEGALHRERALREAGAALVAASGREDIFAAALQAVRALTGKGHRVGLFLVGDAGEVRSAVPSMPGVEGFRNAVLLPRLPPAARAALEQGQGHDSGELQELARSLGETGGRAVSVYPILVGDLLRGFLILSGERQLPPAVAPSMTALVSQVVLALESSQLSEQVHRQRSESRFSSLVQAATDVITVIEPDATVLYQSPSVERVLGYLPEDLVGTKISSLLHPDDRQRVLGTQAVDEAHPTHAVECRVRHADGSWRNFETTVTNLLHDPNVEGLVLNSRDVTDRHRLETELRHAQKLESVGQLAAGIAHEINTPVQFVGDNVRFLRDAFDGLIVALERPGAAPGGGPGAAGESEAGGSGGSGGGGTDLVFLTEEVPLAIDQTLQGVERIATIVRAMKAFGHPSGEQKAPADLNQAVRDTLIVANNAFKYVADVVTELGELPPVWCHLGDINQVLLNLIVNASHAISAAVDSNGGRGTITVRTSCDGAEVAIEVADTGVGIPPEIAERIFEPFFTTKEVGEGTGQGLSLAYSLVHDRHGGSIGFRTEPGRGTTFTVRLPVGSAPRERVQEIGLV